MPQDFKFQIGFIEVGLHDMNILPAAFFQPFHMFVGYALHELLFRHVL